MRCANTNAEEEAVVTANSNSNIPGAAAAAATVSQSSTQQVVANNEELYEAIARRELGDDIVNTIDRYTGRRPLAFVSFQH